MSDNPPNYDPVLGRIPSGLYILTAGVGPRATGMLASWVMQAGFDPPMVSVAVKHGRYVGDWLAAGEPFVLNLVGESGGKLLKHFGKGFEPEEPAFEGCEISLCPRGVPVLRESVGAMQCEPIGHADSGDHRIFVAKVVRGELISEESPMVHVRKSGARY